MIKHTTLFTLAAGAMVMASAPQADAALASYVWVVANEPGDTRFHLGEVEAFAAGQTPNGLGGATFDGLSTSTNDIGDGIVVAGNVGAVWPAVGTTSVLEHGGANQNPNNVLESAGAVWSTANGLPNAQYLLDLGGTFDVTEIRLWPRADGCCAARWDNLEIQLLDAGLNPVPGTLNLHTANVGNVALSYQFDAVPEPSAFALLGLAAGSLLFRRKRG